MATKPKQISSSTGGYLSGFVPIFVWPSPSLSGHPHLCPAIPIFVRPDHPHRPTGPPTSSDWTTHIVRLDHPHRPTGPPTSSDRTTHIVWSIRPDPPDLTGFRLVLFMHSCMFSFHNRMSFRVLSSSTFCLRLDPRSSILISVTYPCLSNSGSH